MNCQKFELIVGDLTRGQMVDADTRSECLAHVDQCATCARRMHDEEMLTRGLASLATQMNLVEASDSIETRLLTAFRHPEVVVPMRSARAHHQRYWLAAVAALLLIVFGVVTIRVWNESIAPNVTVRTDSEKPQKESPGKVTQGNLPSISIASPEGDENVVENRDSKTTSRHALHSSFLDAKQSSARNRKNNTMANHATEIATDFMPLGYLNPATLQDGGQIVRVEVPRTTLASFGLPVNMDRFNERVKADVLFGVDGRARAIRFVQDKRLQ